MLNYFDADLCSERPLTSANFEGGEKSHFDFSIASRPTKVWLRLFAQFSHFWVAISVSEKIGIFAYIHCTSHEIQTFTPSMVLQ